MIEDSEAIIIDPNENRTVPVAGLTFGMSVVVNVILCAGSVGATYAFMRSDINAATARVSVVESQLSNIQTMSEKLAVLGSKVDDLRMEIQQLRRMKKD